MLHALFLAASVALPRLPHPAFEAALVGDQQQDVYFPPPKPTPYEEPRSTGGSLYVEQDSVLAPWTDKDYTMGVAASFSGARIRRWGPTRVLLAWPMDKLNTYVAWFMRDALGRYKVVEGEELLVGMCDDSLRSDKPACPIREVTSGDNTTYAIPVQTHAFQVGVTAFTPRKGDPDKDPNCLHKGCILHSEFPVYNDRPYASLLYFDYRRQTALRRWAAHSSLTFGILGLQVANVVQSGIHAVSDPLTIPRGWKYQISNGGEPTVKYSFGGKFHALSYKAADLTLDGDVNLGYYTNATSGVRLRLGYIKNSPFWSQDRTPISNSRGVAIPGWLTEFYFWASAGQGYWRYNALLQGQLGRKPVTLAFDPPPDHNSVDSPLNRYVWDWQVGGRLRTRWLGVSYQYNKHRNLFEGPHKRHHSYWSLNLAFN